MNIASLIVEKAKELPDKKAVVFPKERKFNGEYIYTNLTFLEFEQRSNQYANAFKNQGIKKGDRVLLFVKPSLDFSVLTFALFKIEAVPVLIDPGMGKKNLLEAIKQCEPKFLIGEPIVNLISLLYKENFKSIEKKFTVSKVNFFAQSIHSIREKASVEYDLPETDDDEMAAILFTSGGTGIPKGVVYTHGIFRNQAMMLQDAFNLTSDNRDLPGFPLFSLFTIGMGMTSYIPDMDPRVPALCDPEKIVKNIYDSQATFVAGSPSIWERVGEYCLKNNLKLDSVKQVVMFGAPVSIKIHEMYKEILTKGDTYTPYGATECLPVSLASGTEILDNYKEKMKAGHGTFIGKHFKDVEIKIHKITDEAIPILKDENILENNLTGEIIVKSKTVTPEYFKMENKTTLAKIYDGDSLWHRMGDVGYLDNDNNLWFCGRLNHRVYLNNRVYFSVPLESFYLNHKMVSKASLTKVNTNGAEKLAMVIERKDHKVNIKDQNFFNELKLLASQNEDAAQIETFILHKKFPVDVRHNIKIDRVKLAQYAQEVVR